MDIRLIKLFLIGGIPLFFYFMFSSFITKLVDEKYESSGFEIGEICYLGYEVNSRKSAGPFISINSYYFLIDGQRSKNLVRPYFPFNKQFDSFIEKMDKNKCYKAKYIEVKILFYKQRRIYQIIDEF